MHWAPSAKRTASKIAKRVAADRAAPVAALAATPDSTALVRSSDNRGTAVAVVEGPSKAMAQARSAASRARELVAVLLEHIEALQPRPGDHGATHGGRATPGVRRDDGMLPAELRVRTLYSFPCRVAVPPTCACMCVDACGFLLVAVFGVLNTDAAAALAMFRTWWCAKSVCAYARSEYKSSAADCSVSVCAGVAEVQTEVMAT